MSSSTLIGRYGESIAADFLRKKGFEILASGYRGRYGEIDIICFVEVKTRQDESYLPARTAVGEAKRRRIMLTAQQWIQENDCRCQVGFDIIEIYLKTKQIRYIPNAFV